GHGDDRSRSCSRSEESGTIACRRQSRAAGEGVHGALRRERRNRTIRRSCLSEPEMTRLRDPKRVALLWMLCGVVVSAQQQAPARSARDRAPVDLTGYWVSYVTENWRYRMVTPAKGEYRRIPSSRAALPIINAWDPAADERVGNQCKSYGAGNIMSVPGRLHITWQDADTLKIETDAGTQTR